MPTNEERATTAVLVQREIETMEIYLWGKSMRSAISLQEFISVSLAQGASREAIKQELVQDLANNGRIFGEFRKGIKATAQGSVHRFRDTGEFGDVGTGTQKFRWVAVLINTCPDCMDRHAKSKTWEKWEDEGLPRTGYTICKEHCRCVLIPAESSETEVIKREKRTKK